MKIIIGIIAAAFVAVSFYFGMVCGQTQITSKDASFNTVFASTLLHSLDVGDMNLVTNHLSSWLDGNVFAISRCEKSPFSDPYRKQMDLALSHAAAYRKDHPRTQWQGWTFDPKTDSEDWGKMVKGQAQFLDDFNQTIDRLLREAKPLDNTGQQTSPGDRLKAPPEK